MTKRYGKNRTRKAGARKQASKRSGGTQVSPRGKAPDSGGFFGGWNRENGIEWVRSILVAVFLALLIRWPLAEPFKIPSGSMEPTFFAGDRIFVDKHIYGVRFPFNGFRIPFTLTTLWYSENRIWQGSGPERWDVVVFKSAEPNAEHDTLVKRVVGLPGERILIRGGKVFADGVPLTLPDDMPDVHYTSPSTHYSPMQYGVRDEEAFSLVPENSYLVLGDNSAHSRDGRYFGWLPNKNILGRVTSIWWPLSRLRDLTGFTETVWWNSLLVFFGLWVVIRLFFGRSWRVYTEKLGTTFAPGEHLFVNRIVLGFPVPFTRFRLPWGSGPERGAIVLYHRPPDSKGASPNVLLGRVGGLPGERVFLEDGTLFVNDMPVERPASLNGARFSGDESGGPFGRSKGREYSEVPARHFFVLADDADYPDSRILGWVARKDVIGTVGAVWWPIPRWRRVNSD